MDSSTAAALTAADADLLAGWSSPFVAADGGLLLLHLGAAAAVAAN